MFIISNHLSKKKINKKNYFSNLHFVRNPYSKCSNLKSYLLQKSSEKLERNFLVIPIEQMEVLKHDQQKSLVNEPSFFY